MTFLAHRSSLLLMWFGCRRRGSVSLPVSSNWSFYRMETTKTRHDDFPFSHSLQLAFLVEGGGACLIFSFFFFFLGGGWGGGGGGQREESLKCEPVFMFVSGFPSLPTTASSFSFFTTPLPLSIFSSPLSLPVSPRPTLKYNSSRPQLSPHPAVSLYTCQPLLSLPVFVLQSGSRRGPSGRWGEGKPVR